MARKSMLFFLLLAVVHVERTLGVACNNKPGVTFKPCSGTGAGGASGAPGGGPEQKYQLVECCKQYTFTGPGSEHYEFTFTSPFVITISDLKIAAGEQIKIKSFKCDPKGNCHVAVIDGTATLPIVLAIDGPRFTITTKGKSPPVMKFTVCDSKGNGAGDWKMYKGCCYKVFDLGLKYFKNEEECVRRGSHLASPQNKEELRFMLDSIKDVGDLVGTGTYSLNKGTTWINMDGTPVNNDLWIRGKPTNLPPDYYCSCLQYNFFGVYNCLCNHFNGYPAMCKKC